MARLICKGPRGKTECCGPDWPPVCGVLVWIILGVRQHSWGGPDELFLTCYPAVASFLTSQFVQEETNVYIPYLI